MAPEILKGLPYKGDVVDYFALATILFHMYVKNRPYEKDTSTSDQLFSLIH